MGVIQSICSVLQACFDEQMTTTALWHTQDIPPLSADGAACEKLLRELVVLQHSKNFALWHVEDKARRTDVDDSLIADCKRKVDVLNQQRNDCIERVDSCFVECIKSALPHNAVQKLNTETVGMAIDRLSILALKIYHMKEQTERVDVEDVHKQQCANKLAVLQKQRDDLIRSVIDLVEEYASGRKVPMIYYQFKMYNDPKLNPELYTARK